MSFRDHHDHGHAEPEVHLRDYLLVLRKHVWLVAAVFVAVVTLAAVVTFRQTPLYHAAARVLIEKEAPTVIAFKDTVQWPDWDDKFYPTQYQILESRSLAEKVVDRLRLQEREEFRAAPPKEGLPAPTPEEAREAAVDGFLGRVRIDPVRNTRIVNVGVTSREPKLAALMANTLADVYIEETLRYRTATTLEAGSWLTEQSAEARRKLEESERALQAFNERNDIISLEQRQSLVVQKLEELNAELTRARADRIELETRTQPLREARGAGGAGVRSIPQVMANPVVQALRADLARLERELEEAAKVYTGKHPRIIALEAQVAAQRDKIAREIAGVEQGLVQDYRTAERREQALAEALEAQKRQVQTLNEQAIAHGALRREVETNREIFQTILAREKETGIAAGVPASNIRIVDRATVPRGPVSPRTARNLALALVLGLVGGIGLAFLVEYFDDSVRDPGELERHARLAFLGAVPLFKDKGRGRGGENGLDLVVEREPKSVHAEAYRLVRTNLLMATPDWPQRAIAVTSAEPEEGKSVTAANLACAMAAAGQRVLLVDADMRKPRLHKVFGVANLEGLSSVVAGGGAVDGALHRTAVPNLTLLTSGPTPPNPSEMLGSERMGRLLAELVERFDRVIFDTTPILPISDASVLASRVDGVVMVVRAGKTGRKVVRHARDMLRGVKAHLLGVVLNRVDRRKHYYASPYYYGAYYGEPAGAKEKPAAGARA